MRRPNQEDNTGPEETIEGIVTRSTGSWYQVQAGDRMIPSKIRGKFRLQEEDTTNPIAVGDRVSLKLNDDGTGMITEIHDRTNRLSRRAAGRRATREHVIAANIDFAWVIQSIRKPKINTGFIDRFLVMTEASEIAAGIVFNKLDLMQQGDQEAVLYIRDMYQEIGYPVLLLSARTGEGMDRLRESLAGKTSVVAGPSGVGKSTLLNAIDPGLDLTTGEVSERTNKGKHTTTYAALHALSSGGFVVDTPGIREFGILDLEPEEVGDFFVEFRPFIPDCRLPSCTHDHEPGCAVREAVDDGVIEEPRYYSYLNILESVRLGQQDVGR
jgi:ribosome biogenesis GTPase / thiamine phosphate phosphatase